MREGNKIKAASMGSPFSPCNEWKKTNDIGVLAHSRLFKGKLCHVAKICAREWPTDVCSCFRDRLCVRDARGQRLAFWRKLTLLINGER